MLLFLQIDSGEVTGLELYESGENYLETILVLKNKHGHVRSIDIARTLSFSKPSVSRAVSILKKAGYITVDSGGLIELTASGLIIAEKIYHRHTMLTEWLTAIGVDPETASRDACRMEHVISQETFEKIGAHIKSKR
jgi:DtxR family Mn-dependent transcriptional regulator